MAEMGQLKKVMPMAIIQRTRPPNRAFALVVPPASRQLKNADNLLQANIDAIHPQSSCNSVPMIMEMWRKEGHLHGQLHQASQSRAFENGVMFSGAFALTNAQARQIHTDGDGSRFQREKRANITAMSVDKSAKWCCDENEQHYVMTFVHLGKTRLRDIATRLLDGRMRKATEHHRLASSNQAPDIG
jgi:hypothetical protein